MTKAGLERIDGVFSIHRLPPESAVPGAVSASALYWIGRTEAELSIVCPASVEVPGARTVSGWACMRVIGPVDFAVTGLLAGLAGALAEAGISIFALSTFDTDYLLVPSDRIAEATAALRRAGYGF
jgi:hypothetical protein